jgi:hypothetical protein
MFMFFLFPRKNFIISLKFDISEINLFLNIKMITSTINLCKPELTCQTRDSSHKPN